MRDVLIVGCGDIGHRVAMLERGEGFQVYAVARSPHAAERLAASDIEPVSGDLDWPDSLAEMPVRGSLVYYFAPPPPRGATDPRLDAFLHSVRPNSLPERIVLISTTGVYGDCGGQWVTERRAPRPGSDRARRRLDAERSLQSFGREHRVPVVVLRVPGIYGPGRLPERRLRAGEPVLNESEAPFSNRIHADDLARACVCASRRGLAYEVYNVSDDKPTTMTDYFFKVADLLGIARPPAISMREAKERLSPGMLSYLLESRRIDNTKMHKVLGVELMYPDIERGLPSCVGPSALHWVGHLQE